MVSHTLYQIYEQYLCSMLTTLISQFLGQIYRNFMYTIFPMEIFSHGGVRYELIFLSNQNTLYFLDRHHRGWARTIINVFERVYIIIFYFLSFIHS